METDDIRAFETFVLDNQQKAFSVAYRMLGNVHDARDALQDAFLKAFRARQGFRGDSAMGTWFYRIVVNAALDSLRRRRPTAALDELPDMADVGTESPEDEVGRTEIGRIIRSRVEALPERQRDVFLLKHFEGMKVKEIGETLGLAEGTVKVHLSRAVHALREGLSDYEL